jgi:hypothetical protein
VIDLREEMRAAAEGLGEAVRGTLLDLGIAVEDIDRFGMCGVERIKASDGLYEPAPDGELMVITPVRVDSPATPESPQPDVFVHWGPIVDLVAWHPAEPELVALRVGAAEWLGCIAPQYCDPEPVPVHRSVLSWLCRGRTGLVMLSPSPADQHRTLGLCRGGLIAADAAHAQALRNILAQSFALPPVMEAQDVGA